MTLADAISCRSSLRHYLPDPISPEQREELAKAISQSCRGFGVQIRLVCDCPQPFASPVKTYGLLSGVRNFLLFSGPADLPDLEEQCGYCGEQVILAATAMGLGTCWVGGTYDQKACQDLLPPGQRLVCAAAIGHVPQERSGREKLIRRVTHRSLRELPELCQGLEGAPAWFAAGMAAVQKAPSAMNRQPYRFHMEPDGTARAVLTEHTAFSPVDLGIAKLHFALGAHGGTWTWGDGGIFRKAEEEKSCGAVIWRQRDGRREYLLARHNGGHWSFPKGHVEGRETEEETARREILEETGLVAEIDTSFRQVVTYSPKSGVIKDVVFFLAVPQRGTERPQEEEISQIGWFPFPEARTQVTFASDVEILLAAEAHLAQRDQPHNNKT